MMPSVYDETISPPIEGSQAVAQAESLAALKSSENLSRRASKRFSAYTSNSILTAGISGNDSARRGSPARNVEGSASRELSMVMSGGEDSRGSNGSGRKKGKGSERSPPPKLPPFPSATTLDAMTKSTSNSSLVDVKARTPTIIGEGDSELESAYDKFRKAAGSPASSLVAPPLSAVFSDGATPFTSAISSPIPSEVSPPFQQTSAHLSTASESAQSPLLEPEYPIQIFLQIGQDVKKVKLEEQSTLAGLRAMFVEKFQYHPGLEDFPTIYLMDPVVNVRYELEDLSEVRMRSIVSLNIDTVQQVKSHIDSGLSNLATDLKDLRSTLNAMRRASIPPPPLPFSSPVPRSPSPTAMRTKTPSNQQFQSVAQKVLAMKTNSPSIGSALDREGAGFAPPTTSTSEQASGSIVSTAAAPSTSLLPPLPVSKGTSDIIVSLKSQHNEVQSLRREISVLRQIFSDFTSSAKSMISNSRSQNSQVQSLAVVKTSAERSFLEAAQEKLESESISLIRDCDEVQDRVDALKHDIVNNQVRPPPSLIPSIRSALEKVKKSRLELADWVVGSKGDWKATWMAELNRVVEEQQILVNHEATLSELELDLMDATSALGDIEKVASAMKGAGRTRRDFTPPINQEHRGLSTVLLEVKGRAATTDGNRRLEGIAEMERRRELENANRTDEFADELGGFVAGNRLKKSGGYEEAERIRELKAAAALKAGYGKVVPSVPIIPATSSLSSSTASPTEPPPSSA